MSGNSGACRGKLAVCSGKCGFITTLEEVVLAHQVNFFGLINVKTDYVAFGEWLAKGGRWAVDVGLGSGCRRAQKADKNTRCLDAKLWAEADFFTDTELQSSIMRGLQNVVTDFFSMRASEAEVELYGRGMDEVIDGIRRQADQVDAMWNSLGARVAAAQDAQDLATIPRGKGRVSNAAWLAILGPFFEEYVLQSRMEDNDAFFTNFEAKAGAHVRVRSDGSPEPQQQQQKRSKTVAGDGGASRQKPAGGGGAAGSATVGSAHSNKIIGATPASMMQHGYWSGLPEAAYVVGRTLGKDRTGVMCRNCGRGAHSTFECPVNYFNRFGACPGFDAGGNKVAAAWVGEDITADTKKAWAKYVTDNGLEPSRNSSHTVRFGP